MLGTYIRKNVATVAGLLLVAGQAAAGSNNAISRFNERVGASEGEVSELAGVPRPALLSGAAVLVALVVVVVVNDDNVESA